MATEPSDLSPDEVAALFSLTEREPQTIAEMDACWERLRAIGRAKQRLACLSPSEVHDAIRRSREVLGEDGLW